MQVGVRYGEGELSMRVAGQIVAEDQPEADGLELGKVGAFVIDVRNGQVDVDDWSRDQVWHGGGSDVMNAQHPVWDRVLNQLPDRLVVTLPPVLVVLQRAGLNLSLGDSLRLPGGVGPRRVRPPQRMDGHGLTLPRLAGSGDRLTRRGPQVDRLRPSLDAVRVEVSNGHVTDLPRAAQQSELPVSCTLGVSDGPARLRRWQLLHQRAEHTTHLTHGDLEVRYRPGTGVLDELQELVAEERVCCVFVTWVVTEDAGQLVLRVTAPAGSPENIEPIAALFTATD